ncbi:hypothetical protein CBP36_19620 (plasmid) [Acidovorax carolinensis]|uniref:Methyltransferase type 11 domain-containing protein n=1 Tax=Acidovorax carolinensis TaxID=553814 RepID=A0A240UJK8_9BURK|nr:class I SAM-dependent methyltransferase [Acidovorax carolinensis]ART57247.1 hypothetical protein CBP35_19575 [Acidovorax carolinensis]ART61306.1 hypothetical protein CBP36_19620 [Acidovorax carolinensis]
MSSPFAKQMAPSAEFIINQGATVVDCGCYGWRLADRCEQVGAMLIGVDQSEPPGRPRNVTFAPISAGVIALPDGVADVVVASHVLEHVIAPVEFMWELTRITSPGGLIWLEAPSELSAKPIASTEADDHSFESFWDDPTHIRPWTPGALYRLALSCHCVPLAISRCDAGGIPSARMVARKSAVIQPAMRPRYVSLRNVPPGVQNAWAHVWGGHPDFSAAGFNCTQAEPQTTAEEIA